ncbi:MAG: outer membrane beta-barrel protein [bacterium]
MYKKILCISVLACSLNSTVFADEPAPGGSEYTSAGSNAGIYLGGQLGMSSMHYGASQYLIASNSVENYKFAGRGYLGYAFSQFIAAELGYDYYGRPKFKNTNGNTQDILQQGFDLVGKASLPLDYGFGFYIKGGLAWVHRSALNNNAGTFAQKDSNSKIVPVGAVGVSYWFTPNMATDLSWTKTMTIGDLPTVDFIALGLTYKINI